MNIVGVCGFIIPLMIGSIIAAGALGALPAPAKRPAGRGWVTG